MKVRVGRSAISGLGLFATKPIKKYQIICEYTGKMIPAGDDRYVNKYLFEINSRWDMDGSPKSNIGRYANHACGWASNAWSDTSQRKRIWLIAKKQINPGDEILYDYGKEYSEYYLKACRCEWCRAKRRAKRNGKANGHGRGKR